MFYCTCNLYGPIIRYCKPALIEGLTTHTDTDTVWFGWTNTDRFKEHAMYNNIHYTGPDGTGDFKVNIEEQFSVGHGSMSPEASSDTEYLYRAAPVSLTCCL